MFWSSIHDYVTYKNHFVFYCILVHSHLDIALLISRDLS